jgi:hypothetical protein
MPQIIDQSPGSRNPASSALFEEMIGSLQSFTRHVAAEGSPLDEAQLKKIDTTAMAFIVAVNLRRLGGQSGDATLPFQMPRRRPPKPRE